MLVTPWSSLSSIFIIVIIQSSAVVQKGMLGTWRTQCSGPGRGERWKCTFLMPFTPSDHLMCVAQSIGKLHLNPPPKKEICSISLSRNSALVDNFCEQFLLELLSKKVFQRRIVLFIHNFSIHSFIYSYGTHHCLLYQKTGLPARSLRRDQHLYPAGAKNSYRDKICFLLLCPTHLEYSTNLKLTSLIPLKQ